MIIILNILKKLESLEGWFWVWTRPNSDKIYTKKRSFKIVFECLKKFVEQYGHSRPSMLDRIDDIPNGASSTAVDLVNPSMKCFVAE